MVNFARRGFLGTYEDFRIMYEKPILQGEEERAKELSLKLKDVVLRRGKNLLKAQLPSKKEWIIFVKLSNVQVGVLFCRYILL